jgi:hypothetical protein
MAAAFASRFSRIALSAAASAMPQAAAPARGHKTITKRRRKEIRKDAAASMRALLTFAKSFDPRRTSRLQVKQTLQRMGYDFSENEVIAEGLVVDFALTDWYCAFEVVEGSHYVLPSDPLASDDIGLGPGVAPVRNVPGAPGRIVLPLQLGFFSAPPDWLSPVRGLALDRETAARHAAIREKGWKLVTIPQPLWEFAATKASAAHYARRDLLLARTLPLVPFEARTVTTAGAVTSGASLMTVKARARAAKLTEREAAVSAVERAASGTKGAEELRRTLTAAENESFAGRSRKARRAGRARVSAALDKDAPESS